MKDYLHYLPFFQQMRDEEQFFDGVLETDDGHRFPVHRVVLGLATVYFQTLFTDPQLNQKRIENNKEVYHISGVPYDLMKTIVDYCYSGQIHFTSSNVKDILVTANRFLIIGIVLQCCEWLQNKLSPENCIGYMRVAGTYQNNSLLDASRKCLLKNFHRISSLNDEFCTLSLPELYNFIRDDELGISDEMMAVDAIIQWILHDPAGRCLHLPDLLKAVRLGLLNVNDLIMKIRQRLRLHLSADCSDFLCRINESMKHAPLEVDGNNYFCRPRIPYEIPFVIGGWTSGYPTDFVETFDIRAKRWSYVMNVDKSARAYHRLETLKGCIYILGGFDGTQYYNTVRCYDPVLKHWMDKAPMYHHRCYVSSCVIGDLLYALGGFDGRARLDSAERYDPNTNQWVMISPMKRHRSDASAAAFKGKAYIIGGFTGEVVLGSAEFYDPESDIWTYIAPMNSPRSGVSMIMYHNNLYAFGGFNGYTRLCSGEKYDPFHNRWTPIGDMLSPRSNFTAVVLEDRIFVIGGFDGTTTIAMVEIYNAVTDTWSPGIPMNVNRSALCACVLKNLPNGRDYTYLSHFQHIM